MLGGLLPRKDRRRMSNLTYGTPRQTAVCGEGCLSDARTLLEKARLQTLRQGCESESDEHCAPQVPLSRRIERADTQVLILLNPG
jgi:hypothetical protein